MVEKEKSKGKVQPFGILLRPSEEVLWMSSRVTQTAQQRREAFYALMGTIGLFVVTVIMFSRRAMASSNPVPFLIGLSYEISPCCSLLAMIFLPTLWLMNERWPTDYDYAVTSERLLHRYKDQIQTIRLEDLPAVSLRPTGGTHGTLRFGDAFPAWHDLENAAQILKLINDARQEHLKEI